MRRLLFALVPLLVAAESGAQVIRRGSMRAAPPAAWLAVGAAQAGGWTVPDGATSSRWQFGSATQYHLGLERAASGLSYGLHGTTSRAPLRYTGLAADGSPIDTDADANVSQLFASVHVASGRGFHTVVQLDAGATHYSNFRARGTGDKLAPSSDTDFTFSLGYGFGFGLSERFSVEVVRDLTTVVHQKDGLAASDDTNHRIHTTRLMARLGLGGRK